MMGALYDAGFGLGESVSMQLKSIAMLLSPMLLSPLP
jgi:hypothetical protein